MVIIYTQLLYIYIYRVGDYTRDKKVVHGMERERERERERRIIVSRSTIRTQIYVFKISVKRIFTTTRANLR